MRKKYYKRKILKRINKIHKNHNKNLDRKYNPIVDVILK